MKLDVSSLIDRPGASLAFRFEEVLQDLADPAQQLEITGPVLFEGEVRNTGREGRLTVSGQLTAELKAVCTRCLTPLEQPIQTTVDVVFGDAQSMSEFQEEDDAGVVAPDYPLTSVLDLDPVARDGILLAIPMQILCSPECKGCCPRCGADLNKGDCSCDKAQNGVASPFDILKQLL